MLPRKSNFEEDLHSYGWDDKLPDPFKSQWDTWIRSLNDIGLISLPRSFLSENFISVNQELHVFSDASDLAIGYVAYLRSKDSTGGVHVSFITASSRVTPRSATTIPRLEICAAVEASLCAAPLVHELKHNPSNIFLYTDSQIVLGYLKNQNRRFSKYIERIVDIIHNRTNVDD